MNHIVLYQPEIPQNTGNIMRTCAATNTKLHLIRPLGFELTEKNLKRAGMDYVSMLQYEIHDSWEAFLATTQAENLFFLTRYGKKAPSQFDYKSFTGDLFFVLGKESTGIPKEILRPHLETCMRLPMVEDARSLNLSNCAAIIVYEALRQQDYPGLVGHEVLKGENWIEIDE
ncbi:MAG: tRNA (uridine(34)/cytosine(34)/5-carboxymethylaminomethyluridine(34)-2'-O)-methyltransferase TrmL [Erysipelotrichaceae bacterium]